MSGWKLRRAWLPHASKRRPSAIGRAAWTWRDCYGLRTGARALPACDLPASAPRPGAASAGATGAGSLRRRPLMRPAVTGRTPKIVFSTSVRSGAHEPGETIDLTGPNVERHVAETVGAGQALHVEQHRAGDDVPLGKELVDGPVQPSTGPSSPRSRPRSGARRRSVRRASRSRDRRSRRLPRDGG